MEKYYIEIGFRDDENHTIKWDLWATVYGKAALKRELDILNKRDFPVNVLRIEKGESVGIL